MKAGLVSEIKARAGHPFVGPAGLMLDKALEEAALDRKRAYVTNAVKHFKFVPVRAARQAPPAQEAECGRDQRLQAVAVQ